MRRISILILFLVIIFSANYISAQEEDADTTESSDPSFVLESDDESFVDESDDTSFELESADLSYEQEDDFGKPSTAISTRKYEGDEGVFIGYNSSLKTFNVRYYSEKNPSQYDEITYYYDEKTSVDGTENGIEGLEPETRVVVALRELEEKIQHFNISRSADHLADSVSIIKSAER